MLMHFTVFILVVFCAFLFIHNFYSLYKSKSPLNKRVVNLKVNPSNFSLIRKFLKRLYSDDFEIDTFGSKGFATWGRIIKFYSKDECKHLDITIEYKSTYSYNDNKEFRVLYRIYAYLIDDQLHSDLNECIFNIDFMKCIDSRSEKYIQVKKPYKFVEYIDKNFEKFEKRKQQRLEEELTKEEQLERENVKRMLSCI
jgi:hypothetical protein